MGAFFLKGPPSDADSSLGGDTTEGDIMRLKTLAVIGVLATLASQLVPTPARAGTDTVQFSSSTYQRIESASTVQLTVSITGTINTTPSTVDYATSDGSAGAGSDYTAKTGTLAFPIGVNSRTITVNLTDDTSYEDDQTFMVTLSNPTGEFILGSPSTATVTIQDDDVFVNVDPETVAVTEEEDGGSAVVKVQLTDTASGANSASVAHDVTYQYSTGGGTATAGSDYTSTSGTGTIPAGYSGPPLTISIPILDNSTAEPDETFLLTLSTVVGGQLGSRSTSTITIDDDEASGQTLAFSSATATIGEGGSTVLLTVDRSGGTTGTATVAYATADGTATAGTDYSSRSGTLTFPGGQSSRVITVPITNDTDAESDETFTVTLSSPTLASLGSPSSATVTITDNDGVQTLAFSSATASVGESVSPLNLIVTRTGDTTGVATVNYATSNGSASSGSDYTDTSGTLVFAAGDTSKNISVVITNDSTSEATETFTVTLSSPTGASLGSTSTSTVSIVDDDGTEAVLGFSSSTYSVDEGGGSVTITVTRSGSASGSKSVTYATSDGTASSGSDYTSASGTLTFPDAATTSMTFEVPVSDDSSVEGDETVSLTLSSPTGGAVLGTSAATLTIGDDDSDSAEAHERSVSLQLRKHLRAKGTVTVEDGTTDCYQRVTVRIQRKRSGVWKTIDRTVTDNQGDYRTNIPDKVGRYRAKVATKTLDNGDTCSSDTSGSKRHRH
jgi:Calx-beta domain